MLRLDDFSCFVANWTDKATNLRSIAKQLNIGLDLLVFVDDNPAERSIVRQMVPEVAVPEVSVDPIEFRGGAGAASVFSGRDARVGRFQANRYYRANAKRAESKRAPAE